MDRYRKLIVAIVGVVAIVFGPDFLGLVDNTEVVAQSILALLTAFGVYQAPNSV